MKIDEEIQQGSFQSSRQKAIINIMFTNGWISHQFKEIFKNFSLTNQQYNVLRILRGAYPKSLNPGEIKEVMLDKNPDLTRLCDRLYKLGYIERYIDAANKRKMNIRINDDGMQILDEMDPVVNGMHESKFSLSEEEAQKLSDLLDKLRG